MKFNIFAMKHGFLAPDAGTLVNATDTYVNAYTGDKTAFSAPLTELAT